MFRRHAFLLLLLFPPILLAQENSAIPDLPGLVKKARTSLVTILQKGRDGGDFGTGTGFIIDKNGLIATNWHVIGEGRALEVTSESGNPLEVVAIEAHDRSLDLAIIRVREKTPDVLSLGSTDNLRQGDPVAAMGNPMGLDFSVVQGVVSAIRPIDGRNMIQLAVPIERGNSGGPLLDKDGKVAGIVTMKSVLTANLGFAVPVEDLQKLLASPNPIPIERWLTVGAMDKRRWEIPLGGDWSRHAAEIRARGTGQGFGGRSLCLWKEKIPDAPYEIRVRVKLGEESGAAGLIFAASGPDENRGFYPSNGRLRLTKFKGPSVWEWEVQEEITTDAYHPGEWNELMIRVEKDGFVCLVNGTEVARRKEIITGSFGLCQFRGVNADFRGWYAGPPSQQAPLDESIIAEASGFVSGTTKPGAESIAHAFSNNPDEARLYFENTSRRLEAEMARSLQLEKLYRLTLARQKIREALQNKQPWPLARAALWCAWLDNPEVDVEGCLEEIADMAQEISVRVPADADTRAIIATTKQYLFTDNGFHGSRTDYDNKANSYLNQCLEDREGLPITLSILFLELAHSAGAKDLFGASLPGHFMVGWHEESAKEKADDTKSKPAPTLRLLDVFDQGRELTVEEAREMLENTLGYVAGESEWQPATPEAIIARLMRNLAQLELAGEDPSLALPKVEIILDLEPGAHAERLTRALLLAGQGEKQRAADDISLLIKENPPGLDMDRLVQFLDSLATEE